MKKLIYLFLTLFTVFSYGQADFPEGIQISGGQPTVSTVNFLTTVNATDGLLEKIAPINLPIPYAPVNYSISSQTIGQHLTGIDTRLGQISSTSAGITQRVYFTADNTTVNSVVYFASSLTGKGSTATGSPPALVLGDDTKAFFTKDVISIAQPVPTIGYAGTYSGNLTVSASSIPASTQQRFTVEIYRTNNLGVPIASGVSGAPIGNLGVTVVAILDSGLINLVDGAISNVPVIGILSQNITLNTGERLKYHVSAAKIGTNGNDVTFGVYYGSSYNSYYDIPVAITTDAVLNKSTVVGVTDTDALNALNASIPVSYSNIVYVNDNNPNSATIFDLINPPVINDNLLKSNTANLYIGLDSSTWVYNSTSLNYVTKTVTSTTSNFYISGTTTDAGGSKTADISRTGNISTGKILAMTGVGNTLNVSSQPTASIKLDNLGLGVNEMPTVAGKTSNNTGLTMMGASEEVNSTTDMRFEIRRNTNADYTDRTTSGWRFTRFGTVLIDILRNGNTTFNGNLGISGQTASTVALFSASKNIVSANTATYPDLTEFSYIKGITSPVQAQLNAKANNILTGYVSGAGTVASTDTVLQAIQKLNGNINSVATSGTYTPTLTNTTNLTSSSLNSATYIRVGDIVTVTVSALVSVTTTNTLTTLTITLPVNRVSTANLEVGSGVGLQSGLGAQFFPVFVQMATNTTQSNLWFRPTNSGNHTVTATFQYKVN